MHEMGIIHSLAKTLEDMAAEQNITKYGSVTLEVGEVSGIITELFEDYWQFYTEKHPVLKGSVLKLETIKAVTLCTECGKTYETVKYGKTCPHCGSTETYLTTTYYDSAGNPINGTDVIIKEVEAETDDDRTGETVVQA